MRFKTEHFKKHNLLKKGSLVRFFFNYDRENGEFVDVCETRCSISLYGVHEQGYEKFDEDKYKFLKMHVFLEKIELNEARKKYKNSNFKNPNLTRSEYFVAYSITDNKVVFCSTEGTLVEEIRGNNGN